ncbi:MAG: 4Fe-4S binding protein [Candidatus Omnitrophica bacterium]|nr:4Fe-4S binding protein [Candidatus Omnitrophota bacterium]MCM8789107.1 4Fe-4S binding protein [Candidatus Omnitrophota bacterium]
MEEKKLSWKEIPEYDILEAGTSKNFKTGNWRNKKPVHIAEKCIHCLICWIYCPDSAIKTKDGKFLEFDYDYCKGCGICARECPKDAIVMEPEKK